MNEPVPQTALKRMPTRELLLDNDLFFTEILRLLDDGTTVTLRARGRSMFPFIVEGRDCVVLSRCRRVAIGDIVLARLPEQGFVLHRVYGLEGDRLLLMGDGNLRATEQCRRDEVLATAVRILRNGRSISCDSRSERWRAALWRRLLPLRRVLLALCRRMMGVRI